MENAPKTCTGLTIPGVTEVEPRSNRELSLFIFSPRCFDFAVIVLRILAAKFGILLKNEEIPNRSYRKWTYTGRVMKVFSFFVCVFFFFFLGAFDEKFRTA